MPSSGFTAFPVKKEQRTHFERAGLEVMSRNEALEKHGSVDPNVSGKMNLNIVTNVGQQNLADLKLKGQMIALVPRTPDINAFTAVCVTPRFAMAPLFPGKLQPTGPQPPADSWIYVVYARKVFNTHGEQCSQGLAALRKELLGRMDAEMLEGSPSLTKAGGGLDALADQTALWPLFAQEVSCTEIEAQDVICAVPVRRDWKGDDWTHGCRYTLTKNGIREHNLCNVDVKIKKAVELFLWKEEMIGETPSRSSGFYKNTTDRMKSIDETFKDL